MVGSIADLKKKEAQTFDIIVPIGKMKVLSMLLFVVTFAVFASADYLEENPFIEKYVVVCNNGAIMAAPITILMSLMALLI